MQEIVTASNIGQSGIISDINPMELPIEGVSNGNNVRPTVSGMASYGGYEALSTPGTDFSAGYLIHNHADDANAKNIIVAGDSAVYQFDGSWTAISSTAGYSSVSDSLKWTGCNLGKMTILNHPDHEPEYYDNVSGTRFVQLPWDASNGWSTEGVSCKVIRSHKNYLFALNLTESGTNYSDAYRWSHPADSNGIPFSWDETDTSSLASRESIGAGHGEILDGLSLRDSFVIYSSNGIDVLDSTGDDFLFRRRSLSSTFGILATNCVAEIKGVHYFLTDGDIMSNDGTTVQSIIHGKMKDQLTVDLSTDNYENSYVVKSVLNKELWFCIPTGTSTYPNVAYIYNWYTKAWGRRDLPSNIAFAYPSAATRTAVTFASATGTIEEQRRTYDSRLTSPAEEMIVGCDITDSSLKILEVTDANQADYEAFVERTDLALLGVRQHTTVNAIYPHIDGHQTVQIQVGSQDYVNGPVRWSAEIDFNPNTDRKVDVRSSGALHCYRVSSSRAQWTLLGMDFEYSLRGLR